MSICRGLHPTSTLLAALLCVGLWARPTPVGAQSQVEFLPDLIVESLTHSPSNPTTADVITFTAVVKNTGPVSAGPSVLNFRVGGETFGQDFSVPALAPGATHTVQRQECLAVAQGYRNTVTADPNNAVTELNENNNVRTDDYIVSGSGLPDLIVSSVALSPESPTTGDTITFTGVVRNIGAACAGRSMLNFKVDVLAQTIFAIPPLAPNASHTVQRQEVLDLAKEYTNTWTADFRSQVTESNEDNNITIQIYVVNPRPATITTVAGTGVAGFSGDRGPATSAKLNFPRGVAWGGSFYIADRHNHRVRRADGAGNITTVAGTGVAGFSGDGGPATSAQLNLPYDVAVDSVGNLYIADLNNHRIRMVAHGGDGVVNGGPDETITTVAGNGIVGGAGDGGPATAANLWNPKGVAVFGGAASGGTLYIAAEINQKIRGVDLATGIINTVAGTGVAGFSGDGPAAAAQLNGPNGVAVDGAGNVYVADTGNDRIRRVSAGSIITVAGGGAVLGDGGLATSAQLDRPTGVVVHPTLNDLYIADFANNRVRKVDAASGVISTVAGTGVACTPSTGECGDGGAATAAQLNGPADIAIDPATGDLYIADLNDHRIRRVGAGGAPIP